MEQEEINAWAMACPQRVRLHAVTDAVRACKAARAKAKQTGVYQSLKFRSRKDRKQRFAFDKVSLKEESVFGRGDYKIAFHPAENVPPAQAEGTKVVWESGRFYLVVPVKVCKRQNREPRQRVCALDPGVRTFLTYYSSETHGSIGSGDFSRIVRLCFYLDDLISRMSSATSQRRYRMKRAADRLRWKIKDLISELHRKAAVFFATRFDRILMPSFETSQMARKASRRIRSKTVRAMLTFAFYRFRCILESVAERYGSEVIIVNEAYTSKTCSYCGNVQEIGGRKRFRCKKCHVDIDRDFNGARGIYISCVAGSRLG